MNNTITKLKRALTDEKIRFSYMAKLGLFDRMPDEQYLKRKYKSCMGVELDLENPKTFNEKLQWLKLHDRRPEYTVMVDKYKARDYIAEKIGEQYLIPLLGVWGDPDEIDFSALPERFVLKCNHNSGTGMCICKDKQKLDVKQVKTELRKGLQENYYLMGREWPYKDVPRKIICEKYMVDNEESSDFTDYKFFCFDGYVDCVMVCLERTSGDTKFYFFDKEWKLKRINIRGKNAPPEFTIPKPHCMNEMFEIAAELSKGIPFVRVDLYQSYDQVYFGEMTFYPDSGFDSNLLPETDDYFGKMIKVERIR